MLPHLPRLTYILPHAPHLTLLYNLTSPYDSMPGLVLPYYTFYLILCYVTLPYLTIEQVGRKAYVPTSAPHLDTVMGWVERRVNEVHLVGVDPETKGALLRTLSRIGIARSTDN